ncbi:MAG: DUF4434 domain-containing protein [Bacteroidetes bacterium]|nr:DUF4434 domain-containing protein [Bacteroidota bacterium]
MVKRIMTAVFLLALLGAQARALAAPPQLKFSGQRFKILQLTDLHWIQGNAFRSGNDSALNLMRYLLKKEKPDLVVFTGDIVVSRDAAAGWKNVIRPLEDMHVPFAVAFGNHDTETDLTKSQTLDVIRSSPYNVTYNADPAISGVGNCALTIRDETGSLNKWVIYLFDSHAYAPDSLVKGYDWIHNDQIQWYRRQSASYASANGGPLPSLAFFHIPLPEFATVSRMPSIVGIRGEDVCAPPVNSGLFTSFVEMRDVCGVFAGHDHNNDFAGVLDNICLAYGRKTGYNAPYPETLEKGARVIELYENDRRIDTYIRTLSGSFNEFSYKRAPAAWPVANGTFIQNDLIAHWDDNRWQHELRALKEVGMHYIVLAPTLHTGKNGVSTSNYPSRLPGVRQEYPGDLVENCLRNAKKAGFKVFLGLNFHERWWEADFSKEWLNRQMELGNKVADELVQRYKQRYGSTLYGWYWVWEVDNMHCKTPELQDVLAETLNTNLDHLNQLTPEMPFMLCPFMNYRVGEPDEYRQMWTHVFERTHFRAGDIFAPQDGIGAGGLDLDRLQRWYEGLRAAVDTRPELLFWSDAETFDQRWWTIAPLDRFVRQMQIVRPYVSDVISFAYSHYYSPYKVDTAYHDAYRYYTLHGMLPSMPAPLPVRGLRVADDGKTAVLSWQAPDMEKGIAGYYVFRDGKPVGNNQYDKAGRCSLNYFEKETLAKGPHRYEVCAYTCTGVLSEKRAVIWAQDGFLHNGVIAHRGAWKGYDASENSISSLKNAIGLACEGSEFDVWMSIDSAVVISHDPSIGGLKIEATTAAELEKLPLKNGDHVPTLQQYLDIIKSQHRTRLFLEIKSSQLSQQRTLALTDRVVRMVHDNHAEPWVSYISFNYGVLQRVRELDPEAETAYLGGDKKVEELRAGGLSGLDYPYFSFHSDTAMTGIARRAGMNVNVWTVDNGDEMRFLLSQGVDRITTNEPALLLDILEKRR